MDFVVLLLFYSSNSPLETQREADYCFNVLCSLELSPNYSLNHNPEEEENQKLHQLTSAITFIHTRLLKTLKHVGT